MVPVHTLSIIAIMFSHLFNTYEAVTPPPKSHKDFYKEIYQEPEDDIGILNPLGFGPISRIPHVEKPSDQPFEAKPSEDFMPEEIQDNQNSQTNNQLLNNIINTGRSFVGSKYLYGGTSPSTGFDCSGFLQYIFKQNGVNIPRDTSGIFKTGREVSLSNAQPGDIICSRGSGPSGRHVQMVSRIDPETNQIYVIEAKGRKYGIVEEPLTKKVSDIVSVRRILSQNNNDPFLRNQDIQNPNSQKFSSNQQFARTLNQAYRKALQDKGLDPNYSYILTAQDANETGWGKSVKGYYNYGNITTTGNDWHKRTGNRKWKDFKSLNDYANYKIDFLSRNRYRFFQTFSPNTNVQYAMQTLADRGYDPGNPRYGINIYNTYNTLMKYLI